MASMKDLVHPLEMLSKSTPDYLRYPLRAFYFSFVLIPIIGVAWINLSGTPLEVPTIAWVAIATGPSLSILAVIHAAFRHQSESDVPDGDRAPKDPSARIIARIGLFAFLAAAGAGALASVRTGAWIAVILLEAFVVGSLFAAGELTIRATRRRSPPPDSQPAATPNITDPDLRDLYVDVARVGRSYQNSSKRWTRVNYGLGFLAAIFSGGAGITGLTAASPSLKTTFAVLGVVGAALASLGTTLGAAEAQAETKFTARKLEALSRKIRWHGSLSHEDPTAKYLEEFNELTTVKPKEPTRAARSRATSGRRR